eukprot:5240574-Pyramimonas_sp.AAC.1
MECTHKTCCLTSNYDRYLRPSKVLRYMNKPCIITGPPATKGCNPLQGPIVTPDYLDIVENDAQRGPPISKEEAIGRMGALH